jgi:hypothetical protein
MGVRRSLCSVLVVGLLGWALPAAGQPAGCEGLAPTFTDGTDGDDVLVGTPRADRFHGGGGDDLICGGGGNDHIYPGDGADRVDGGGGRDLVAFDPTEPLLVDLTSGTATGEGDDRLVSIEDVDAGCSRHGDVLIGDGADNFLLGAAGPDTITGGEGADRLYGEEVSYSDVPPCGGSDGGPDTIDGGPGDDVLFGHYGSDDLEGSDGFDAIHGGWDAADVCRNGELNVSCETEEPPPPPPACSDGIDNDGSDGVDYGGDGGCAAPRDPTEDSYQDPVCYDGIDNDASGTIDFPADPGCHDYEDYEEYFCPHFSYCPPPVRLTIDLSAKGDRFFGRVKAPTLCRGDRAVSLFRRENRQWRRFDRTRSDADGSWRSDRLRITGGRYRAITTQVYRETEAGDVAGCAWDWSRPIRVRG